MQRPAYDACVPHSALCPPTPAGAAAAAHANPPTFLALFALTGVASSARISASSTCRTRAVHRRGAQPIYMGAQAEAVTQSPSHGHDGHTQTLRAHLVQARNGSK